MSFDRTEAKVIRDALLAIVRVLERRYQLGRHELIEQQMRYNDASREAETATSR